MKCSQISLKKNYIFKLIYQILSMFVLLLTTPYVSRVLGPEAIGKYSYANSLMTYFTMATSLGTVTYGTREVARCRENKQTLSNTFWGIELMTIITFLVSITGWLVLICFSTEQKYVFIALIPLLCAAAADISWLYTGLEKVHYTVVINLIFKMVGVIAIFTFVKERSDLLIYVFILSAVTCLGNFSMWIFLPQMVKAPRIREIRLYRHFRQTLKYFITSVAISIYTILDKTMIGLLTNNPLENGYYEKACEIINMTKPVAFSAINDIMTPRMSYLFAKNQMDEVRERINSSLGLELMLSIGCGFGISCVSDTFVPLYLGAGYEPVVQLIKMMAPILCFICVSTCLGSHYYVPSGHILDGTKLTLVGSAINIIVNAPLIMCFGAKGAVVASLIAEGTIAVLYAKSSKAAVGYTSIWNILYKKIVAGLIMVLICSYFGTIFQCDAVLKLSLQVFIGVTVYFIMLTVMKDTTVIYIWKELLKRLRR